MNKKDIVKNYVKKHRYFSLSQIIEETNFDKKLIKDYLFQLKEEKSVYDAGYGYYSTVAQKFPFEPIRRVETIRQEIKKKYPLIDFLIWDTKLFAPLYHHTQTHHITFVEVETEAVFPVYDYLDSKHRFVLKEKRVKSFFAGFDVTRDPVVIRVIPSRSPRDGNVPALEKILVDMYLDLNKYNYIAQSDYFELWWDLVRLYRINIGELLNYSRRRRCLRTLIPQLTDNINSYTIDFCHIMSNIGKSL